MADGEHALHAPAAFDHRVTASKVSLVAHEGTTATDSAAPRTTGRQLALAAAAGGLRRPVVLRAPQLSIQSGAPPIAMRGLTFERSESAPPLTVTGGELEVESCSFLDNRASAIYINGGVVRIRDAAFDRNGAPEVNGGAIAADAGEMTIEAALFTGCTAASGGAIYAGGSARVWLREAVFANNTAGVAGGAISVSAIADVQLAEHTLLRENSAPDKGKLVAVDGQHARVSYVLPAPLGMWIPNTIEEQGDTKYVFAGSADDEIFPFQCPPGVFGNSELPQHQSSPQCSGLCASSRIECNVLPSSTHYRLSLSTPVALSPNSLRPNTASVPSSR